MRPPSPSLVTALVAITFVVAACASQTGSTWTYAPVASEAEQATAAGPTELEPTGTGPSPVPQPATTAGPATAAQPVPEPSPAPELTAPPAATPAPAIEPGGASGEGRVIELESTASLLFLQDGQRVPDIAVTPGETLRFRIDNTAGFGHNFYIGQDEQLVVPFATTEVGIPVWETGVQELEWVVPDDISGLKFGCTVPGHYFTQQGTFSLAP